MKRHYFLGGTTAKGYYRFYDDLKSILDRVMFIDSGMTSTTHPILNQLVEDYERDYEIGCVHNHVEPDKLEAMVIPERKLAVIDRSKTAHQPLLFPKLVENVVYMGEGYNYEYLYQNRNCLTQLYEEKSVLQEQAIKHFEKAHQHHEDIEKIYIEYLNFDKANRVTNDFMQKLFRSTSLHKTSQIVHRYLGAATPDGPIDFVLDLTSDIDERIFIKGRSGTGKSTMLRKIVSEAQNRGIDVEIYHCGFDPESLDMVILRELSVAIFDATAPHEHEPERSNDHIFDAYELFVDGNPDASHEQEVADLKGLYKSETKKATSCLDSIRDKTRSFEKIYQDSLDDGYVQGIIARIQNWIN
ncbi:hypothetical protein [Aquisalibacillus elongatus]|uniref:Uncharacterized protein n=1 Tax=Aquisalibacillus elongatus TaxID=485577 RepID=A0A3N5B993_9BACI|nr:hypothetical protein [Aquisalibacillus elongatus]RPF54044.1 hypothetical protein EDC24_1232 [Aquisalibacillus elongatus]